MGRQYARSWPSAEVPLASVILLLVSCGQTSGVGPPRQDEICGSYNGRRMYLEPGEKGTLSAHNLTLPENGNSQLEQCGLELVTCPACILSVRFVHLDLAAHCSADAVWLSEPPYEEASRSPFCTMQPGGIAPSYRSLTRALAVSLQYSQPHAHGFTMEYSAELNRQHIVGNSTGTLTSPYFPAPYPRDITLEHVITCRKDNCRVRLIFQDFLLAADSVMEFVDWSGQRLEVTSGAMFRPPVILSTGPSLAVRFRANGASDLGYKATYSFLTGNFLDKFVKPITDCGGLVENMGGAITMMNMVERGVATYDCVWLIRPQSSYAQLKTHLYLKVDTFLEMAGTAELQVLQGVTSDSPVLDTLRNPFTKMVTHRSRERVIPISDGFYVSLRGTFGPASRLAIVYAAFSYMNCFTGSDFMCKNSRCIPARLHCDGFNHCGDNSDEPESCYREWALETSDRRWYSHTPNYYFPKMVQYPDLTTATVVFLVSSAGLILVISAMIVLLCRMGTRARQQRELQSQLQTISDLLADGVRHEDAADEPPVYEAPPDYDDIIKVFIEGPMESHRSRRKRPVDHAGNSKRFRSGPGSTPYRSGASSSQQEVTRPALLTVNLPPEGDSFTTSSAPALQTHGHNISRSCQTTPIPDSPPPAYVEAGASSLSRVHSDGNLTSSFTQFDLMSVEEEEVFQPDSNPSGSRSFLEEDVAPSPDLLDDILQPQVAHCPLRGRSRSGDNLLEGLPHQMGQWGRSMSGDQLLDARWDAPCDCKGACGCATRRPLLQHSRSISVGLPLTTYARSRSQDNLWGLDVYFSQHEVGPARGDWVLRPAVVTRPENF